MRGADRQTGKLFSYASPESLVPPGHPLRATEYGRRNAAEWTFSRLKRVLGGGLRSRRLDAQQIEATIAAQVLNRMAELGMPRAHRIA